MPRFLLPVALIVACGVAFACRQPVGNTTPGATAPAVATAAAPPQPAPLPAEPAWLPPGEQDKVSDSVRRGVAYLKTALGGNFRGHLSGANIGHAGDPEVGAAALAGLALLTCDVPATDPAVRKAAELVRRHAPKLTQTYGLATCVWFLDRLDDPADRPLLQTLGVRVAVAQDPQGGWPYVCPEVPDADQPLLMTALRTEFSRAAEAPDRLKNLPALRTRGGEKVVLGAPIKTTTNSLTLFAMLALWVVQRHGVPADRPLALAEARFRACQRDNGNWEYFFTPGGYSYKDSMTCAGLVALALGRGADRQRLLAGKGGEQSEPLLRDAAVDKGFRYLAGRIGKPGEPVPGGIDAWSDLYFLWAVERVAVVYDVREIGGKEWYPWGAGLLLKWQRPDGSWASSFPGAVDTSFALLFLQRGNVARGLPELLRGRS